MVYIALPFLSPCALPFSVASASAQFFVLALVVAVCGAQAPQQIHIAFAGEDPNGNCHGMAVSWATDGNTATSTVKYGLSADALTETATGTAVSYITPLFHHHVVFTGLKLKTQYFYSCGDEAGGFSPVMSFVSAAGYETQTDVKLAIYGDMGFNKTGNAIETHHLLEQMMGEYDFVYHVGDISYADDWFHHDPNEFGYENVYNGYMNWMQPIVSAKPYMVLPGNHETECHSPICLNTPEYREALRNFTAYNARFRMPSAESGATAKNMWYSFNYGPVHFVSFDTETDFDNAPEGEQGRGGLPSGGFAANGTQVAWLAADLAKAAANRAQRPWIIVSGHRPIYNPRACSPEGAPLGDNKYLQEAIEDLLHKYDVDMYFAGHVHAYFRTYPVYNNVVQTTYDYPTEPMHLIVGSAGCDELHNKTVSAVELVDAKWLAARDEEYYGMGIIHVENSTTLKFRWFHSVDGSVADEFHLHRKH